MLRRPPDSTRTDTLFVSPTLFCSSFAMSPKSHLFGRLFINGEYEPELAKLFLKYLDPSRDVIDIVANIGFFSVLAGRRLSTGRVLSVEPTAAAFARLSRNVEQIGRASGRERVCQDV